MTGSFYWQPGVNWRILLFTTAVACATGVLFGLAPALTASRQDLGAVMKDDAQSAVTGRGPRLRKGLVVAQLAACTVLLTVGGILVGFLNDERSMAATLGSNSTIETYLPLSDAGIAGPAARATQDAVLARVRQIPGVRLASLSDGLPGGGFSSQVRPQNADGVPRRASIVRGGSDWFETTGIRIERGRSFQPGETGVAVLDHDLAEALWPGQDPIGKQIYIDHGKQMAVIVGLTRGVGAKNAAMYWHTRRVFLPLPDDNRPENLFLMAQTSGDPKSGIAAVHAAVSAMIPDAPLQVRTMAELFGTVLTPVRLLFTGGAILAAIALILSAIGIYGVTAYTASRRTREIGIRMALGARTWEIVRLTMAQGSRLVALGVGLGMVLSIGAARLVTAQVGEFGVEWTLYAGVAAMLAAIAMLAIFIPARKAAAIDPLNALRKD